MLYYLCQDGTEIALITSEGDYRGESPHQVADMSVLFLVSEIYIWLVKTKRPLKEPQIEKSVFGFLMPADSLVSDQVTFTSQW